MPTKSREGQYSGVANRAMGRKLETSKAIDVSKCPRVGDYYILDKVVDGKDYCDAEREQWMWSIGKRKSDGVILASTKTDLYLNPEYECLWLR